MSLPQSRKEGGMLSRKGYILSKSKINDEELQKIKKELIAKPIQQGPKMPWIDNKFNLYKEREKFIILPRFWAIEKWGIPPKNKQSEGEDINLTFQGNLKNYQNEAISKVKEAYQTRGGGLLCMACGTGKTITALNLISQIKKKTLVIVHKEFLLNQWLERIQTFLPDAKVGFIQASVIDIENKDIVIGMLQSLSMKDYESNTFSSFGHVIIDETHHIAAKVFSKCMFKIQCKYMLGLTATPDRLDGLGYVLEYFLGKIAFRFQLEDKIMPIVQVLKIDYGVDFEIPTMRNGEINHAKLITEVCELQSRTQKIIDKVEECYKQERKIMILSHRRQHLKDMAFLLDQKNIDYGFYIGNMKQEELKDTEYKSVILGTYAMSEEGLDIVGINTVVLSTPKSNIEQSVGRILGLRATTMKTPLIIDIHDCVNVLDSQYYKRYNFYKKKGYVKSTKSTKNTKKSSHKQLKLSFVDDE